MAGKKALKDVYYINESWKKPNCGKNFRPIFQISTHRPNNVLKMDYIFLPVDGKSHSSNLITVCFPVK